MLCPPLGVIKWTALPKRPNRNDNVISSDRPSGAPYSFNTAYLLYATLCSRRCGAAVNDTDENPFSCGADILVGETEK